MSEDLEIMDIDPEIAWLVVKRNLIAAVSLFDDSDLFDASLGASGFLKTERMTRFMLALFERTKGNKNQIVLACLEEARNFSEFVSLLYATVALIHSQPEGSSEWKELMSLMAFVSKIMEEQ